MEKAPSQIALCDSGSVEKISQISREMGFGIEIQTFYDPALYDSNEQLLSLHVQALKDIELQIMHGPFGDLVPGSFDALVRQTARTRFDQAAEISSKLGIEKMILHHGYVPGTSNPVKWLMRASAFWSEFLDQYPNLHVHLENMLERDPQLIADLIDRVDSPRFDACLDVGHAHCHSDLSIDRWIDLLNERIGYVHLHNNDGTHDQHLALDQGTLDMNEACDALQERAPNAIWALEMPLDAIGSSLDWLQSNGYLEL